MLRSRRSCLYALVVPVVVMAMFLFVGCAKPPENSLEALQKVHRAIDDGKLTPELKQKGEELVAEMELQQTKFFKSYKKTHEICVEILAMPVPDRPLPKTQTAVPTSFRFCPYCGHQLP